ncbi:MAG: DNA-binding domain-containing protein [Verrucomicrobiales bacterium]|nr:DNA-binding domain-containing protein [Verrucomicrobiales bacterium]
MNPPPSSERKGISDLERVQRWMLSVISHPDGIDEGVEAGEARRWLDAGAGKLESVVTRSRQLSASERLAVYGNAYYARLLDCLGEVFPVLLRTLGEETFQGFAFSFLQSYPSRSYTLNELGRHFPAFLRETRPEAGDEEAGKWAEFPIDLAELEWAIYEVFDGPGLEGVGATEMPDFSAIPQDEWLSLRFRVAPSLRLLKFSWPVNAHYTAVRASSEGIDLPFPVQSSSWLALSRRDFIVRRYPLDEAQYELLQQFSLGSSLGDALEFLLEGELISPETLERELPRWFHEWASERCLFESIGWPEEMAAKIN